ncbi:hypothetical protein ACU8KH_03911 [Lachancea thermotolerans]
MQEELLPSVMCTHASHSTQSAWSKPSSDDELRWLPATLLACRAVGTKVPCGLYLKNPQSPWTDMHVMKNFAEYKNTQNNHVPYRASWPGLSYLLHQR